METSNTSKKNKAGGKVTECNVRSNAEECKRKSIEAFELITKKKTAMLADKLQQT